MTPMQHLVEDYGQLSESCQSLFNGWQPAPLHPVTVQMTTEQLDQAALNARLLDLSAPACGWLLLSDRLAVINGSVPADIAPLHGELFSGELHIRLVHLGEGLWQLFTAQLQFAPAEQATHLAQAVVQMPADAAPGPLRYWRLWHTDSGNHQHASLSLFNGFEGVPHE